MRRSVILLLTLLTAACATPNAPQTASRAPQTNEEAALASVLQQVQAKTSEYKIGGADLLEITVYQQSELDRKVRVGQTGEVSFPLIGIVKVGGLSVNEASAALSERLKEFIVSPQVTVFIREYGNKKVFVLGEVKNPGSYELPTEAKLTVLEAVSLAGGFTPIAAPDRTKIIRQVGGQNQSIPIEVSKITRDGQKDRDVPLEPNDVVYVPQSYF